MLDKLLKETKGSRDFNDDGNSDMGYRMFDRIQVGDNVELSVQASSSHYCRPRFTLPIEQYENVELAIFRDNEFVSIRDVSKNEDLIKRLNDYYEGTVYGFVPVETVVYLYKDLTRAVK